MNDSEKKKEPGIFHTLGQDFRRGDVFRNLRREYSDVHGFYFDAKQQSRLLQMPWYKRWWYFVWWLLKSMFFKLSPLRRIIIVFGIYFSMIGISIQFNGTQIGTDSGAVGAILILFVLLLELKDKLLAHDELEAGRKIQQALMPETSPDVPGWSLWLFTRPANEVGGDLIDFLRIRENRMGLAMADVAGKGLRAALLTTKLQATLRALASDYDSLAELCSKVNSIFQRDSLPNIFSSMLYLEIQPDYGQVRYVNAGHHPPILVTAEGSRELAKGELALGLSGGSRYTEYAQNLERGEILFAYSDGLTEARNEQGEFFGGERVSRLLSRTRNLSAEKMGEKIVHELDIFVSEARASDDVSIIILKRV